jgi:WD40 repeat protein/serine/threonine protein kinase
MHTAQPSPDVPQVDSGSSAEVHPVEALADEYLRRHRQGEQPSLAEYLERYPELAEQIRAVFPALIAVEQLKPQATDPNAAAAATLDPLEHRERIGDYRLLRVIGRGGMGVVYEAEQESLGRRVALKVLPVHAAQDAKLRLRFQRESRAAAHLHHSNIVPVFEVGQEGDLCFYAMQYIQGQPLDAVIHDLRRLRAASGDKAGKNVAPAASAVARSLVTGAYEPARSGGAAVDAKREAGHLPTVDLAASTPVSPARSECSELSMVETNYGAYCRNVARLGLQVAEALAYAHGRGIVHRDIKPSNLLLDTAGIVWVSDFGLAKTQEQALTETGDLVGTIRYMAPERFQGVCDTRADVYSLGLTLYELLLLRPAFEAPDRLRLIDQIGHQEPARCRVLDPRIPRDLETILMKTIEKDPRRRYATADDLAEDLRRYLADEPIKARRIGPLERLGRWGRRNPLVAGLSAAVVLLIAIGFAGVFAQMQVAQANELKAQEHAAQAEQKEQEANNERDEVRTLNEKLRRTLYAAHMNLSQQAWEAGGPERVRELLEHHRPKPGKSDLRGFEWYYLYHLCHADLLTLKTDGGSWKTGGGGSCMSVAFSPDGKFLASASGGRGGVKVWNAQTGQELFYRKEGKASVAFSPDGKRLAGDCWGQVKVWDAQSGNELFSLQSESRSLPNCRVAFSPNGKHLATGSFDGKLNLWDAQTGRKLLSLQGHTGAVYSVAFSSDGKHLASGSCTWDDTKQAYVVGELKVWDVQSGQELLSLKGLIGGVCSVAFNPDGKRLASVLGDNTVKVWDAQTGLELLSFKGASHQVVFSPDGKRLASGQENGWVKVRDAQTGQEILTFKGHNTEVTSVAFSADGKRLASASYDGTVKVWDAQAGQKPVTLQGAAASSFASVAVSPDGKRLASGGSGQTGSGPGELKVWNAQTGQEIFTLKGHTANVTAVAYSPDGKRQASGSGDKTVKVWDARTGHEVYTLKGHTASVQSVAFSPDGKRLVSGGGYPDATVKVWDAQTGRELLSFKANCDVVVFSPDGKRLASASNGTVLWDAQTGQELLSIKGSYGSSSVAFSPDGRRLAGGGGWPDTTVSVWDAQTGHELLSCQGLTQGGGSVAFSPDGKRLVSTGGGGLKVWDAQNGEELLTMKGGAAPLAFSPDGHLLVTGDGNGGVTIWDATPLPEKP